MECNTRKEQDLIEYDNEDMQTYEFMPLVRCLMGAVIKDIDSINKRLDRLEGVSDEANKIPIPFDFERMDLKNPSIELENVHLWTVYKGGLMIRQNSDYPESKREIDTVKMKCEDAKKLAKFLKDVYLD